MRMTLWVISWKKCVCYLPTQEMLSKKVRLTYTVKNFSCPEPGCHWPNSPWIPGRPGRLCMVNVIPAGGGKIANLFYSVYSSLISSDKYSTWWPNELTTNIRRRNSSCRDRRSSPTPSVPHSLLAHGWLETARGPSSSNIDKYKDDISNCLCIPNRKSYHRQIIRSSILLLVQRYFEAQ